MAKLYKADAVEKETPKKTLKLYKADSEIVDQEPSGIAGTLQDTAFGAVQGATFNLADEAYGLGTSLMGEGSYEENRDLARQKWNEARERSPIATTVGEIGGAVVSPGSKILGAGKGLKGIFRGGMESAAQSFGASDKDTLKEQAKETLVGAGLGAGTGAIANTLTSKFSKSPTAIRSEVLGVKAKDYRVPGPADRKRVVERINETGMLKNRKVEYNPQTLKFEPRNKSKFTLDEIEKNTEDRLLDRAQDASTKLQERKVAEFGAVLQNTKVNPSELNKMAEEIANEYSKRGLSKGPVDRMDAAGRIAQNIKEQLEINGSGLENASLLDLDSIKKMAQEDVKNFSKSLGELGDSEELARITARKLKELVEKKVNNVHFNKINSAQHDFLTVKGDLLERIKQLELSSPTKQSYGRTGVLDEVIERVSGSSQGRLGAANIKEVYEGLPSFLDPAKAVIPYALEETPGALYREKYQGNMKGNWRNPQSINASDMTPMEVAKARLPRTTEGLIQNKELVIAKLAVNGVPPNMINTITQALNEEPESVQALAPMIMSQFPTLFEKSKYNMFDGKIIDPAERAKAADDISKRDDLSSIQRAKIISELNKTGKYLGE
jgi:hypothetical protein